MATAEQKKTITKKRLQELRNQCRDHYNVVADGVLPDGADVRVTMGRLQELIDSCDTKTKAQIAEGMDFLKVKGFEPEAAEAQVNAL